MPTGFALVVFGGTKPVGKDATEFAKRCQHLGAGWILPTSMGGDGTLAGCEFNRAISNVVTMPIIEPGGASTLEHFYDGVARTYF